MKHIMTIILTILIASTIKSNAQIPNTCITHEHFNQLKEYVLKNSKEIKLNQRLICDSNTISRESSFFNRFIELIDYKNHFQIIIIDKNNEIATYFITNENDKLTVSAYYNNFDSDDVLIKRESDFCQIITALNGKK